MSRRNPALVRFFAYATGVSAVILTALAILGIIAFGVSVILFVFLGVGILGIVFAVWGSRYARVNNPQA